MAPSRIPTAPRALLSAPAVLALLGLVCLLAFAAALVAQHRFGMQPCPWCILQRILLLSVAALSLAAAAVRQRLFRTLLCALGALAGAAGAASAVYQHLVAAKSSSCALTLADKLINASGLDTVWPGAFEVRGSCAEAAVSLLGVPFEFWSLTLFVACAATLVFVVLRKIGAS